MNIAARHSHWGVSRDPCQRPSIAAGLTQAREKCVAKGVQHERPDALDVRLPFGLVLLRFIVDRFERALVLLFEARMVNTATLSRSGPHPALYGALSAFPAHFQNASDPRCHRKHAASRSRFSARHQQSAEPRRRPTDVLPAQPIALIRAQCRIG